MTNNKNLEDPEPQPTGEKMDLKGLTLTQVQQLVARATEAKQHSYSPYSKFRVGAVVMTTDGEFFTGCNVECAAYGGTICAERVAIPKAVSEGRRELVAVGVNTDSEVCTSPCGSCRQFIREFGRHLVVVCSNVRGRYKVYTMDELLPDSFGPEQL